jgi:hypothetical protein
MGLGSYDDLYIEKSENLQVGFKLLKLCTKPIRVYRLKNSLYILFCLDKKNLTDSNTETDFKNYHKHI